MHKVILSILLLGLSGIATADINAGINALGRGNYDLALTEFKPEAEQGDVSAQSFLAHTYAMLERYEEAYAWYHLSARCGLIDAEIDRDVLAKKMSPEQIEAGRRLGDDLLDDYCIK